MRTREDETRLWQKARRRVPSKPGSRTRRVCKRLRRFPRILTTATTMQVPYPPGRLHSVHPDGDEAIRQTDTDAAAARYSAVQKGYISDPFVRHLLPRGAHLQPPRPPLINIGTYVRTEGIDQLVNGWLELSAKEGRQCQIVSLGAGSDTRFWRIAVRGPVLRDVWSRGRFAHSPEID